MTTHVAIAIGLLLYVVSATAVSFFLVRRVVSTSFALCTGSIVSFVVKFLPLTPMQTIPFDEVAQAVARERQAIEGAIVH